MRLFILVLLILSCQAILGQSPEFKEGEIIDIGDPALTDKVNEKQFKEGEIIDIDIDIDIDDPALKDSLPKPTNKKDTKKSDKKNFKEGETFDLDDPVLENKSDKSSDSRLKEGKTFDLDDPSLDNSESSLKEGKIFNLDDPSFEKEDKTGTKNKKDDINIDIDIDIQDGKKQTKNEFNIDGKKNATLRDWLDDNLPFELSGFIEARGGIRLQNDPVQPRDGILGDIRLQLEANKYFEWIEFRNKVDFYYDAYREQGIIDVREANILLVPFQWVDIKIGRQILTWGTGDLLFINDMFPKDWKSFFNGRDTTYLKAPSDAVRINFSYELWQLNIVYSPVFNSDRYINGDRISFWDKNRWDFSGREDWVHTKDPNEWFQDDEWSFRLFKNIEGYEIALYGYYGFWKSPAGQDLEENKASFPDLAVYGASIRGNFLSGITNFEVGYYYSLDDKDGDDPLIRNSEWRFLLGYKRELFTDFTLAVQYYIEWKQDYDKYKKGLPSFIEPDDRVRHVITLSTNWLLLKQNLTASFFGYYSPNDKDVYLRPNISYKITDNWKVDMGANLFFDEDDHTFFGQFKNNNNVYIGARWSF